MATDPAGIPRDLPRLGTSGPPSAAAAALQEGLDRVTRLSARLLRAPIAALSLLDGGRAWEPSGVGVRDGGVPAPLEGSVAARVVSARAPLRVSDLDAAGWLGTDRRMRERGIRGYAGVPLLAGGEAVGVLWVADTRPRSWRAAAMRTLGELAALAAAQVEGCRATGVLRAAEGLFRALVEQSLVGIYLVQDETFRYANPRFAEIFGAPAGWFGPTRHYLEIVHPDDHGRVRENVRRRIAGEVEAIHYTFRGRRLDGGALHVEVHGSRTLLGGRPALIGVALDVTDRVRAEEERARAVHSRDRFYAMMSHELRTPVSAIMLYNELLLNGIYERLTSGQREAVERSQSSARHLLALINDLLELSRLEAGRLEARREAVEVGEVAEGVVAELSPLARSRGCEVTVSLDGRPLLATGDTRRTRQILLNLLSNALHFGAGAPVRVRCAEEGGAVVLSVSDGGPGIDPAKQERIFEEFVQLQDDGTGTGLGLAVARRLAELQGGSLTVESRPGEGCTFRLRLASAAPPEPRAEGGVAEG